LLQGQAMNLRTYHRKPLPFDSQLKLFYLKPRRFVGA
jgi:hypothetical protein